MFFVENKFKNILKELRTEKGLTQIDLARELKTYQQNVSEWESGKKKPSMFAIIELAKFFDVTVGQLLGTEEY